MNKRLDLLHPYPFQKLADLFSGVNPPSDLAPIRLSIGEPSHPAPRFVLDALADSLQDLANYPPTKGSDELREAISEWLQKRYRLSAENITPQSHILPVNGTREALFALAQSVVDDRNDALVLMPNPFYQIYEGAALLAGAETFYVNTSANNQYLPELDNIAESVWRRCQLFYACSPGNPTGAIFPRGLWQQLIDYADRYDFIIAADECYSEIYEEEKKPPIGLLQVCAETGRHDFSRCIVFHSLSKRSNLPGLRSGFIAGDAGILKQFLLYRTYHGCAMSPPVQKASIAAWEDEAHVRKNRSLYHEKFAAVLPILSPWLEVKQPEASFYLWAGIPAKLLGGNDEAFTKGLYEQQHVSVLPGSYLSRNTDQGNPGQGYVRMALVAETGECIEAAKRIAGFCQSLGA